MPEPAAIRIDRAAPKDAYDIDDVLRACFSRPAEAMLVKQLAIDGDLVLVLIARDEASGAAMGIVALSRMLVAIGGESVPAIALAPLAVMPAYRRSGVGEALVAAAIDEMRRAGALLMFVLGEPAYYERFGFAAAGAEGFDSPYAGPYFMALELQGGLPCGPRGLADHAPAFASAGGGRTMSFNTFGRVFRFTTWGESHGPALGAVVDGSPPGLALSEGDIQPWLDKRRPGTSRFTTQRREPDVVRILSGVFEGRTTGTPISLSIENVDQRSKDYSEVAKAYRPGHADYAYDAKYGFRDYRGGGRSSARETAARVAAGAVARAVIPEVSIRAWVEAIGGDAIDYARFDPDEIDRNPFFCPDAEAAARWEALIDRTRKAGSSIGAVVACEATGVPAGWGAPIYAKLDSELAAACMSINAVKGVEIGDGFAAAALTGEANADPMRPGAGGPEFLANHAGGIAGGISTGQPVRVRVAFKPTSSILTPVETITREGEATEIATKGRHDPCVGIRGVPVVEAMVALVLADQRLLHRAQCGE